ncbi:MAG: N-acetylmuramoyl-L-alanine amidase [bacterium]|nr:N-acetylmuramoyl-L-alanine amidase [bacterium]
MLKKVFFFTCFFISVLSLYAEEYRIDAVNINGTGYFPLYRLLNTLKLEREYDTYTQRIIIKDRSRYLTFFIEEETIYYERNNILLKDPAVRYNGIIYIPQEMVKLITDWKRGDYSFTFKEKEFAIREKEEVLYNKPSPEKSPTPGHILTAKTEEETGRKNDKMFNTGQIPNRIKFIILDPGHGGHDPGAIGQKGLREKEVVLNVSLYLKECLSRKLGNTRILMTRDKDEFISLSQRAKIANSFAEKNT